MYYKIVLFHSLFICVIILHIEVAILLTGQSMKRAFDIQPLYGSFNLRIVSWTTVLRVCDVIT